MAINISIKKTNELMVVCPFLMILTDSDNPLNLNKKYLLACVYFLMSSINGLNSCNLSFMVR